MRPPIRNLLLGSALSCIVLAYCLSGCVTRSPSRASKPRSELDTTSSNGVKAVQSSATAIPGSEITIATFNIQNFGPAKAGRPVVMQTLADIIRKYDVVAVQEVSDKTEKAPRALLELLPGYDICISAKSGLQADDKTFQEQYAFFFNTNKLQLIGSPILYGDSEDDHFQREPYLARFQAGQAGFSFVLVNIHTRPESAVQEICALDPVIIWAKTQFPGEDDFIALGDFNAGCSYASAGELDPCAIRGSEYLWIVPDTAESNLAKRKCAYDRIVLTAATSSRYAGKWGVDEAFTDKAISDHFPVWAAFVGTAE